MNDNITKPQHYTYCKIDNLDYLLDALGWEAFKGFCLGNVIKYVHRHEHKGKPQEDLGKARQYLNILLDRWQDE